MTRLPFDILEIILVRSVVVLFVDLKIAVKAPDEVALKTVMNVCSTWYIILTDRQLTKRQLHDNFKGIYQLILAIVEYRKNRHLRRARRFRRQHAKSDPLKYVEHCINACVSF